MAAELQVDGSIDVWFPKGSDRLGEVRRHLEAMFRDQNVPFVFEGGD